MLCAALGHLSIKVTLHIEAEQKLTPWLWFSPMVLNSNSLTFPIRVAILVPVNPAPAADFKI